MRAGDSPSRLNQVGSGIIFASALFTAFVVSGWAAPLLMLKMRYAVAIAASGGLLGGPLCMHGRKPAYVGALGGSLASVGGLSGVVALLHIWGRSSVPVIGLVIAFALGATPGILVFVYSGSAAPPQ